MSRRWSGQSGQFAFALALVAIAAVGIALRALPLFFSPLPFNPDGIIHARNAHHAVRTGRLPLDLIAPDDLAFGSFLALIELITGVQSLRSSQPVIAIMGTFPAIVAGVVARRICLRLEWGIGTARAAGLLAAGLLAVEGIFLYRSMPVDEQTVGMLLSPLAITAFVYGLWQTDWRWLVVAVLFFLILPAVHNLDTVITGLSLLAVVVVVLRSPDRGRLSMGVSVLGTVGFWVYAAVYTFGITRFTPVQILQQERLLRAPGLFVAWLIFGCFLLVWFLGTRSRTQRVLLAGPFAVLFALLGVNVFVPVFPGMPKTAIGILVPTLALLLPLALAVWVFPITAHNGENTALVVALFAGPLILIAFTLSVALSPVYLTTSVRTQYFVHLPTLALAGVAGAAIVYGRLDGRRLLQSALVVILLVSVVASVPMAFAGLSLHPYKGITTTGEFATSTFAHERVPGSWTSDDHLVRISQYHVTTETAGQTKTKTNANANDGTLLTSSSSGQVQPVYRWVQNDRADPPACPIATKDSWQTVGAQFFPRPPETVETERFNQLQQSSHRIYHGGSTDRLLIVVPRAESNTTEC